MAGWVWWLRRARTALRSRTVVDLVPSRDFDPSAEEEKPPPRRTQAEKWAINYAAAREFYEREGHLRVPRKHIERIAVGDDRAEREFRLGAWIGNQRSRAATLTPERVELLSAIGMRWS
ncbi:helicase associated domain-containing protein [Streptomyces filamentosus]|uniref:helicase associated domain-containing protein n=1 Tax=Streptomyces filamentosus TaxID=67294 RepID=UPI0037F7C926